MKSSPFIQRAEGDFTVMLAPHTPHCGPDQADFPIPGHFRYEVDVEYDPKALDENGFLLDNLEFKNYFNSLALYGPISMSCEKLCESAEEAFCQRLGDRRKHCHGIKVRLWAMPGVSIEYDGTPAGRLSGWIDQAKSGIRSVWSAWADGAWAIMDFAFPFVIGFGMALAPVIFILWLLAQASQ